MINEVVSVIAGEVFNAMGQRPYACEKAELQKDVPQKGRGK